MFEVFNIRTGEVRVTVSTEQRAGDLISVYKDLDYRLIEDRWPEYESVMEMEKYQ